MLGYLFSPDELQGLFRRLGYRLDEDTWRRTVDYYLHRTSHGSTLSGLVHGWVLARARRADAWTFCQEALRGDIADVQDGTTGEGIHLGAMAYTLDLVQRGLTGLEPRGGALWLDPVPLPELSSYGFELRYQGHWGVRLRLERGWLEIAVPSSGRSPIDVHLPDRSVGVQPGRSVEAGAPRLRSRSVRRARRVRGASLRRWFRLRLGSLQIGEQFGLPGEHPGQDGAGDPEQLGDVRAGQRVVHGGALLAGHHQVRPAQHRELL